MGKTCSSYWTYQCIDPQQRQTKYVGQTVCCQRATTSWRSWTCRCCSCNLLSGKGGCSNKLGYHQQRCLGRSTQTRIGKSPIQRWYVHPSLQYLLWFITIGEKRVMGDLTFLDLGIIRYLYLLVYIYTYTHTHVYIYIYIIRYDPYDMGTNQLQVTPMQTSSSRSSYGWNISLPLRLQDVEARKGAIN